MKDKVLEILKREEDYISGQKISDSFNMTRSAIWKHINKLKEEGYEIESSPRLGYRLVNSPDRLSYAELATGLKTKYIGRDVLYLDTVDSTNKLMKEMAKDKEEGFIIVSEEQTLGRGRMGRDWISPKNKGIYFSLLLKPKLHPIYASRTTLIAAAALVLALEELGIKAGIKWPNDVLINKKKISGILTEMKGDIDYLDYIVVGIGINVNLDSKDIPKQLKSRASSIKIESKEVKRKELLSRFLNNFELLYDEFKLDVSMNKALEVNRAYSEVLGKDIKVIGPKDSYQAKALDFLEDGQLLVEKKDGSKEKLYSGEISVRGLDGYI